MEFDKDFMKKYPPIWLPLSNPGFVHSHTQLNVLSPEEKEKAFRQECKDNVQKMLKAFTFEEHMAIAFTPHVIIDTIWYFVDKVKDYCRDHRISEVKKLSRAINELHDRYNQEMRKDLSQKHLDQIHEKSVHWRELNNYHMQIMFFAISNTLLKEYKSQDYLNCMNWAYCAMKLCTLGKQYNDDINKMILERIGKGKNAPAHWIYDKLYVIMDAYLPVEFKVDDTQIDICMRIFKNNLKQLKYSEL